MFVNPPNYTYGNLGRTLPDVVGPGTINIDMSLIKNIHIWERVSLQIRAEAVNMTNHVNLGMPSRVLARRKRVEQQFHIRDDHIGRRGARPAIRRQGRILTHGIRCRTNHNLKNTCA